MQSDKSNLNILIFVTCENDLFKHKYAVTIKRWLLKVSETFDKKPSLNFTEVNIIFSGIPELEEIKNYDGIVISGSFSRTKDNKPWMGKLRHTIRLCYVNQIPVFGICFGFQILSQAFGSQVEVSPHGFNFGGFRYRLNDKAVPFFRPFIEDFYNDDKSYQLFQSDFNQESVTTNGHTTNHSCHNGHVNNHEHLTNGHSNHDKSNHGMGVNKPYFLVDKISMDSLIGSFSHNDIVTSAPSLDNIDFGDVSDEDRNELFKNLSEMTPITVSSLDKVPVVGVLIGNRSKTFMLAFQLHPEFDTDIGSNFWKEILLLKVNQGSITREDFNNNMKETKNSNSGYVLGKMAISLFMNGYLKPKY